MEMIYPEPAMLSSAKLEHELLSAAPGNRGTRPWVSFNFIASIDGAAALDGLSGQLGNAWDQRVLALLRQNADVILVGAQTVRAEGYGGQLLSTTAQQWRSDNWLDPNPPLAIVSGTLNLDPSLAVFTHAPVRPLILTLTSAPTERREALAEVADVVNVGDDSLEVGLIISALAERGFKNIHSEGGPTLLGSFVAAGLVDELNLTISPLLVGGPAGRIARDAPATTNLTDALRPSDVSHSMELTRILKADSMLFLRYVKPAG